jgi:hypothetical protein
LVNPNTAPLRQWASPNVSVSPGWDSQQLASLAMGIFGKSVEKCWDPVGMKYPGHYYRSLAKSAGKDFRDGAVVPFE